LCSDAHDRRPAVSGAEVAQQLREWGIERLVSGGAQQSHEHEPRDAVLLADDSAGQYADDGV